MTPPNTLKEKCCEKCTAKNTLPAVRAGLKGPYGCWIDDCPCHTQHSQESKCCDKCFCEFDGISVCERKCPCHQESKGWEAKFQEEFGWMDSGESAMQYLPDIKSFISQTLEVEKANQEAAHQSELATMSDAAFEAGRQAERKDILAQVKEIDKGCYHIERDEVIAFLSKQSHE